MAVLRHGSDNKGMHHYVLARASHSHHFKQRSKSIGASTIQHSQPHQKKKRYRVDMEDTNDCCPPSTPKDSPLTLSIFCSPPEPLFNQHGSSILLQESLQALTHINSQRLSLSVKEDKCYSVFKMGKPVAYFMYMSQHFNLPPDIQYRAIELFHRFMSHHVCELYNHVEQTQHSQSPINWTTVEERLTHQITLRALSCLQLASKLSLHYKIISLSKVRTFLVKCGFRYATSSLVQSEIRILKTLDYRVHGPTPLDFIEVLLEVLGDKDPSLPIKQFYGVAIKLLDIYYLSRPVIAEKLRKLSTPSPHIQETDGTTHPFGGVETDLLLLASGIVGAASFILDHIRSDGVVEHLSSITHITSDNILDISALLVEHIMTD